jgi:hypothetical protein
VKLQHYIGGLEGLPEPLSLEPLSVEKRVFVEDWEKRIFGIHVAMMGLSNHLGAALPKYPIQDVPTTFKDYWTWGHLDGPYRLLQVALLREVAPRHHAVAD